MCNVGPLLCYRKLIVCHYKKGTEICNYIYSNTILAVKLNRSVSCLLLVSASLGRRKNMHNFKATRE